MATRVRPGRDQLRDMGRHLSYEAWMLNRTAHALDLDLCEKGVLLNAILESFGIHARGLFDFLFKDNPRDGDVIASDYFKDPAQWPTLRGAVPDALVPLRNRVGKELAHLTLARLEVQPEEKGWDYQAITTSIESLLKAFLEGADPDLLGPRPERVDKPAV